MTEASLGRTPPSLERTAADETFVVLQFWAEAPPRWRETATAVVRERPSVTKLTEDRKLFLIRPQVLGPKTF